MPSRIIGPEVVRGSICRDRWTVDVSVLCADTIPEGEASPLVFSLKWRRHDPEDLERPGDARPVVVAFRREVAAGAGAIHFAGEGNPAEMPFPKNVPERVLTIVGAASTRGVPNMRLVVTAEGKETPVGTMAVGPLDPSFRITAGDGAGAAPATIPLEEGVRFRAVSDSPVAGSTVRWITTTPGVEIRGSATANPVEVVARPGDPPVYRREAVLYALRVPPPEGGVSAGPVVQAVHRFQAGELEQAFARYRHLEEAHLRDPAYRARLEAMRPPEVETYVQANTANPDARVREYLRRLLDFVREQEPLREAPAGERRSITFVMGARGDDFYRHALNYFERWRAEDPDNRRLETALRSLDEVRVFLRDTPPGNGLPWGEVNVVVHANEEGGMSIPVARLQPGENAVAHEVTFETLTEAMREEEDDDRFAALPDDVLDVRTTLRIRGCAIGRRQKILTLLSRAFGGDEPQRPVVRAPRELQTYESTTSNGRIVAVDEYLTEFWAVEYPFGRRPPDAELIEKLSENHPDPPVDWAGALRRDEPRPGRLGDPFHETRTRTYTFTYQHVDVPGNERDLEAMLRAGGHDVDTWTRWSETARTQPDGEGVVQLTVTYRKQGEDFDRFLRFELPGRPPLPDDAAVLAWLARQEEVAEDFRRMDRKIPDYAWNVRNVRLPLEGGGTVPAVELTGRATILRVQREHTEPDPDNPGQRRRAHPPVTDTAYFGAEVPVAEPPHPLGENVPFE